MHKVVLCCENRASVFENVIVGYYEDLCKRFFAKYFNFEAALMKPLLWHMHWPLAETADSHLQTVSQILNIQHSLANWEVYIPSRITSLCSSAITRYAV